MSEYGSDDSDESESSVEAKKRDIKRIDKMRSLGTKSVKRFNRK